MASRTLIGTVIFNKSTHPVTPPCVVMDVLADVWVEEVIKVLVE